MHCNRLPNHAKPIPGLLEIRWKFDTLCDLSLGFAVGRYRDHSWRLWVTAHPKWWLTITLGGYSRTRVGGQRVADGDTWRLEGGAIWGHNGCHWHPRYDTLTITQVRGDASKTAWWRLPRLPFLPDGFFMFFRLWFGQCNFSIANLQMSKMPRAAGSHLLQHQAEGGSRLNEMIPATQLHCTLHK